MLKDTSISPNMLPMETDTDEQPILIQNRFVYGQGTVETLAYLDADAGAAVLEQLSRDGSTIIAVTTTEAAQKLALFFAEAATLLPPARSKATVSTTHHRGAR